MKKMYLFALIVLLMRPDCRLRGTPSGGACSAGGR